MKSFENLSLSYAQARLDQFNTIATYYFPDIDVKHLETCVAAIYWSFIVRRRYPGTCALLIDHAGR
jgi:hypothetical protein